MTGQFIDLIAVGGTTPKSQYCSGFLQKSECHNKGQQSDSETSRIHCVHKAEWNPTRKS